MTKIGRAPKVQLAAPPPRSMPIDPVHLTGTQTVILNSTSEEGLRESWMGIWCPEQVRQKSMNIPQRRVQTEVAVEEVQEDRRPHDTHFSIMTKWIAAKVCHAS